MLTQEPAVFFKRKDRHRLIPLIGWTRRLHNFRGGPQRVVRLADDLVRPRQHAHRAKPPTKFRLQVFAHRHRSMALG